MTSTTDTFNSILKAEDGWWREFVFLTPFKQQTLITDTYKRGKTETIVHLCYVYIPEDKTVRLFRIGRKLFEEIRLIENQQRERKVWRARGVKVGPYWSYQVMADREIDIDLTEERKEGLERLGLNSDSVDLRNREQNQEQVVQQLAPGRILDLV